MPRCVLVFLAIKRQYLHQFQLQRSCQFVREYSNLCLKATTKLKQKLKSSSKNRNVLAEGHVNRRVDDSTLNKFAKARRSSRREKISIQPFKSQVPSASWCLIGRSYFLHCHLKKLLPINFLPRTFDWSFEFPEV